MSGGDGSLGNAPTQAAAASDIETAAGDQRPPHDARARRDRVGRFVVLERLGSGGMGVVFSAYDPQLDRKVALKLLHVRADDARRQDRLRQEAKAMAQLSHSNVVQVYDVGEDDGQLYIAMELINGVTLQAWVEQHPRAGWREIFAVFERAAAGLHAAHERGLVHRDFKPANVMVDERGRVVVLDFGLARTTLAATTDPGIQHHEGPQTQWGVGTPAYMAPEQFDAMPATRRTDQFAFCVALYEALGGNPPFSRASVPVLMTAVKNFELQPMTGERRVPRRVRAALAKGMSVDPRERFPDMPALLAAIAPRRYQTLALRGMAAVGITALASAIWLRSSDDPCRGLETRADEIWNEEVASRVRSRLKPEPGEDLDRAWSSVAPKVERYVAEWGSSAVESCRAHQDGARSLSDHEQAMGCLSRSLTTLDVLVQLVLDHEETPLSAFERAVGALPGLSRCEDPGEGEVELASMVTADGRTLATADALINLGRNSEALELLRPLLEDVDEEERPVWASELLVRVGAASVEVAEVDTGLEHLNRAAALAVRLGHERLLAKAASRLVATYTQTAKFELADTWTSLGLAAVESVGDLRREEVELRSAYATSLQMRWRLDEALTEQSLALQLALGDDGRLRPVHVPLLNQLGNIEILRTNFTAAAEHYEDALNLESERTGGETPRAASIESNLANAYAGAGQLRRAEMLAREALSKVEGLGKDHSRAKAPILAVLCSIREQRGEVESAARACEESAKVYERHDAALSHGAALSKVAQLRALTGDVVGAREAIVAAQSLLSSSIGEDHEFFAQSLVHQSAVELEAGNPELAESIAEQALSVFQSASATAELEVEAWMQLGRVAHDRGDFDEAHRYLQRAIELSESVMGQWSSAAEARLELAETLMDAEESDGTIEIETPGAIEKQLDEVSALLVGKDRTVLNERLERSRLRYLGVE